MISPLQIALQGLAPGSPPITIASQGLIVTITPPEEQEDALWQPLRSFGPPDATPFDSRKKKSKRIDCSFTVEGCRGTLSTYIGNLRRMAFDKEVAIPKALEFLQIIREWREANEWKALPQNASRRRQKAEELLAGKKKKRQLRDDANNFAAAIHPDDLPNAARMLHAMILENARLKKLLQEKTS
jgi:hypothetical protein